MSNVFKTSRIGLKRFCCLLISIVPGTGENQRTSLQCGAVDLCSHGFAGRRAL